MNFLFSNLIVIFHYVVALLPAFISSRIYGLLFALNLGLYVPVSPPVTAAKTTILSFPTNVFLSHSLPARPNTRTILVVHSIAASAHDDPRIKHLGKAFVAANPKNLVVIPYLPPLANADLSKRPAELIRDVIQAVVEDDILCPSGRVSVVSACISAGFTLVASTYADYVQAAFLIGSHADVHNTLLHALKSQGKDDARYGINCVLSGFWDPPNPIVSEMLGAYCTDDHLRNIGKKSALLEPLLRDHPEEARIFRRLHDDVDFLEQSLHHIYAKNKIAFQNMSPMRFLDQLSCQNVVLLHAQNDQIVPPAESIVLKEALEKRDDIKVSCLITTLLNHGDQKSVGIGHIPEFLKMINVFSNFFLPDRRLISKSSSSATAYKKAI